MPYVIMKEGNDHVVYKKGKDGKPTGRAKGRHSSREKATKQVAALYANTREAFADFSSSGELPDGYVKRRGKCFEAGNYPDKKINVTPADLAKMAREFSGPVPVDMEHRPSILDGKLGHLLSVQVGQDRKTLIGEAAFPQWLEQIVPANQREVSLTIDRDTKKIVGMALVMKPRISGAALMSAYAQFAARQVQVAAATVAPDLDAMTDTVPGPGAEAAAAPDLEDQEGTGQVDPDETHQMVHDMMVDLGATCEGYGGNQGVAPAGAGAAPGAAPAAAQFRHDTYVGQGIMQMIHDDAARHGACCDEEGEERERDRKIDFHSSHEIRGLQKIHDACVEHGARCHGSEMAVADYSGGNMSKFGDLLGSFFKERGIDPDKLLEGGGGSSTAEPDTPAIRRLKDEVEAANRRANEAWDNQMATEAAAFADAEIRTAQRAWPAERNNIIAQYVQFARDDRDAKAPAVVTFGEGETKFQAEGRLAAFKAGFALRTPHGMTQEMVPTGGLALMGADTSDPDLQSLHSATREWANAANGNGKKKGGGA
jgi:hypothetical protein